MNSFVLVFLGISRVCVWRHVWVRVSDDIYSMLLHCCRQTRHQQIERQYSGKHCMMPVPPDWLFDSNSRHFFFFPLFEVSVDTRIQDFCCCGIFVYSRFGSVYNACTWWYHQSERCSLQFCSRARGRRKLIMISFHRHSNECLNQRMNGCQWQPNERYFCGFSKLDQNRLSHAMRFNFRRTNSLIHRARAMCKNIMCQLTS